MEKLKNQLQQGDIIMHYSHDLISNIIRKFDQTEFNHCSIYDKNGFLYESVKGGVQRKKIEKSLKDQNTDSITVFRLKNINKKKTHHLIETLEAYPKKGFAYAQILLIFYILWKKKLKLPPTFDSLFNLIFLFFEKFISILIDRKENKNMICSELVYLTYMHTAKKLNDPSFIIHLPFECSTIFFLQNLKTQKLFSCNLKKYDENNLNWKNTTTTTTFNKEKLIEINADKYYLESLIKYNTNPKTYQKNIKKAEEIIKKIKIYNLITPGDLTRSLDTFPVITFKILKTKGSTA